MPEQLEFSMFEEKNEEVKTDCHVIHGDCLDKMREMPNNSIDFIVCDPPYGLSFMGKDWDGTTPAMEIWAEALRVAKPGAMLAAFGGTRTHHHLMLAIEGAGWEIRDCIFWLHSQGFPKSHNFGKKLSGIWEGYGTALKPSVEPIILSMKPLDGTYAVNADKWGVAGINIESSRISTNDKLDRLSSENTLYEGGWKKIDIKGSSLGRWPANLILDEESAEMLDEMTGVLKSGSGNRRPNGGGNMFSGMSPMKAEFPASSGGGSRFFYCAKSSVSERNKGLEGMPLKDANKIGQFNECGNNGSLKNSKPMANHHPTVKPLSLMKYILKLLAPPGDPICLDPFAGSGSTLVAAKELGIRCIGIEKEAEYCEIARKRLSI